MRTFLLLGCFFIFKNSMAQRQPDVSKYPVDPGYPSSFDGTKIYYEVPGEGKPVLLVHDFIVNSHSWKGTALFSDLLKDRYKVNNLVRRGNGKSGKPHDSAAYANDEEAKDIMVLMNLLNVSKYSVAGYTRGSINTARLFVLDKKIESAVLGGMGADFTNPRWPGPIMFYRGLMGDSVPGLKGAADYEKKQGLNQRAMAYLQKEQPSTAKEELPKISQLVLIISCDKDSHNGSSHELAALLPHSSVATTPGDHNHATEQKNFRMKS